MAMKTHLKFKQGPMSESDAMELASTYKRRGYDVVVTDSFADLSQKHLYVYDRAPGRNIAWSS